MMKFLSGVVLTVALCGLYATAQQVTTKLPSTTVKLNGSGGGGSGDVESVTLTGTAPVTVTGSPCASGACAFTLGLGTVPATNGGTGLTTFTLGDLLYSSATNTLAKLAGNTTTTRKLLSQTGDGAASAAPSWVPIYDIPCNTETEDCTFQAPANFSLFINSDLMTLTSSSTILTDAAENPILQVSASGTSTLVKDRLEGDAILQRDKNQLATTGTLQGAYAECATSGGAVVGTLDADTATVGRVLTVTRVGANTCTVAVESGHTLDGVTDGTTTVPSAGWKTFVQTGDTAWVTAGSYPVTGTLSGLTATYVPVATGAAAGANSGLRTVQAAVASPAQPQAGTYLALKTNTTYNGGAPPYDEFRFWTTDVTAGEALLLTDGSGALARLDVQKSSIPELLNVVYMTSNSSDLYAAVSAWAGAAYGWSVRSTGYFMSGSGSAQGTMDTFWGRSSAGVWGAYADSGGTLGGILTGSLTTSHILGGGSSPTVGGSCGTDPAIAGKDAFLKVTTGSGSPTSCVVTFATAYATAPVCNANASTTTTALNVATTTTTVTVSAAALTAAEVLHISCGGF